MFKITRKRYKNLYNRNVHIVYDNVFCIFNGLLMFLLNDRERNENHNKIIEKDMYSELNVFGKRQINNYYHYH